MAANQSSDDGGRDTAVRERLLAEALQLFNNKGYATTSVREIVAAAGVSKPTLYYYFSSKEGIYLALMNSTLSTFQETVEQLVVPQGTAGQRLQRFTSGIFAIFQEYIDVVRLMYAIFFGPPQGTPYFRHQEFFDRMLVVVASMLEDGIRAGEFRRVAVDDVSWAIISCLNTVMEENLTNPEPRLDRASLERMLALILDGIAISEKDEEK